MINISDDISFDETERNIGNFEWEKVENNIYEK